MEVFYTEYLREIHQIIFNWWIIHKLIVKTHKKNQYSHKDLWVVYEWQDPSEWDMAWPTMKHLNRLQEIENLARSATEKIQYLHLHPTA